MNFGGVRGKKPRRNCELINAVKTVKVYNNYGEKPVTVLKMLVRGRTTVFFNYGNIILTPTVYDHKKSLNSTLAVYSLFQTLAVDFSSNL